MKGIEGGMAQLYILLGEIENQTSWFVDRDLDGYVDLGYVLA